jgi:hypothetical protein
MFDMAQLPEARGDTAGAIPIIQESLSLLAVRPPTDAMVIGTQRALAIDLCATGAVAQGDAVIRAAIGNVPLDSTRTMPYRLRGALGFCLTRARRFEDAETMLLQAETSLRRLAAPGARYREQTVAWLVSLYEQWGKPEQAAAWKTRLGWRPH